MFQSMALELIICEESFITVLAGKPSLLFMDTQYMLGQGLLVGKSQPTEVTLQLFHPWKK